MDKNGTNNIPLPGKLRKAKFILVFLQVFPNYLPSEIPPPEPELAISPTKIFNSLRYCDKNLLSHTFKHFGSMNILYFSWNVNQGKYSIISWIISIIFWIRNEDSKTTRPHFSRQSIAVAQLLNERKIDLFVLTKEIIAFGSQKVRRYFILKLYLLLACYISHKYATSCWKSWLNHWNI